MFIPIVDDRTPPSKPWYAPAFGVLAWSRLLLTGNVAWRRPTANNVLALKLHQPVKLPPYLVSAPRGYLTLITFFNINSAYVFHRA